MSTFGIVAPTLQKAPVEYDQNDQDQLRRLLRQYFIGIDNPGPLFATQLTLTNLPISPNSLPVGTVWVENGYLRIVTSFDPVGTSYINTTLNSVSVTIT